MKTPSKPISSARRDQARMSLGEASRSGEKARAMRSIAPLDHAQGEWEAVPWHVVSRSLTSVGAPRLSRQNACRVAGDRPRPAEDPSLAFLRLPGAAGPATRSTVPKRMLLDYQKDAYPAYDLEPEDGVPVPCALGQPWVNQDTQETLTKLRIPRTDPWGKPLPGEPDDPVLARFHKR